MGLKRSAPPQQEEVVECWKDNEPALRAFQAMSTQWNNNGYAVLGLRYESAPVALRMCGIGQEDEEQVLASLRVMEQEALRVINKHGS